MTNDLETRKYIFRRKLSAAANASKHLEKTRDTSADANWFKDCGMVITRYLQEVHMINTLEDLRLQMHKANSIYHSPEKDYSLSFQTLDAIVRSCEKWRNYLCDQESFDLLVCLEVISMVKIHASVISGRNIHKKQGLQGVRLKDAIPHTFTTITTYNGGVQVYS